MRDFLEEFLDGFITVFVVLSMVVVGFAAFLCPSFLLDVANGSLWVFLSWLITLPLAGGYIFGIDSLA